MPFILLELVNKHIKIFQSMIFSSSHKAIKTSILLHSRRSENTIEVESERAYEPEFGEECCKTLCSGPDVAVVLTALVVTRTNPGFWHHMLVKRNLFRFPKLTWDYPSGEHPQLNHRLMAIES